MTVSGTDDSQGELGNAAIPPSLIEQARKLRTPPIGDGSYYAQPGVFDSDEEVDEFLASVYELRHAGSA